MNGLEKETWDAAKALGILGVLRYLWHIAPKAYALWQARQKQGNDARQATVSESRLEHEKESKVGDQALLFAHELREELREQRQRTDRLEEKADLLKQQVEEESEQRKIAWLSVEAAHMRADEADKTRDQALKEMRQLQSTNGELEQRLQEMTTLRAEDQKTISLLQWQIADNNARIDELQAKLDHFEHTAYQLTPVETSEQEEAHGIAPD